MAARNPNLPVLIPSTGIPVLPTVVDVLRNVPSPPTLTTISTAGSDSTNSQTDPNLCFMYDGKVLKKLSGRHKLPPCLIIDSQTPRICSSALADLSGNILPKSANFIFYKYYISR